MIPASFPDKFPAVRGALLNALTGVTVRRNMPETLPAKLVQLRLEWGSRVNEVSRNLRITATVYVPSEAPNQHVPDYDAQQTLATATIRVLEQLPAVLTGFQECTNSYGPYVVKDETDYESVTMFVDLQVRGN